MRVFGKILYMFRRLTDYFTRKYELSMFREVGTEIYIGHNGSFTYKTIRLGNNVYIGNNCVIQSTHGEIIIGNHVMLGPGVNIHGGNHIIDVVGMYMDQVKKEKGQDSLVKIEDDVWIGANAIIIGGITVGEGSVIGAGSVLTKSIPPYSVVAGNPAHILKKRFIEEEIIKHKTMLQNSEGRKANL